MSVAYDDGEPFVSPGTASSVVTWATEHGGELTVPGSGDPQGGELVSPAKAVIERTQSKVTETPSLFKLFIFSPKG